MSTKAKPPHHHKLTTPSLEHLPTPSQTLAVETMSGGGKAARDGPRVQWMCQQKIGRSRQNSKICDLQKHQNTEVCDSRALTHHVLIPPFKPPLAPLGPTSTKTVHSPIAPPQTPKIMQFSMKSTQNPTKHKKYTRKPSPHTTTS